MQQPADAVSGPLIDLSDFPQHCLSDYQIVMGTDNWGAKWEACVRAAVDLQRGAGYPVRALHYLCFIRLILL